MNGRVGNGALPPLTPVDVGGSVPRRGRASLAWLGRWMLRRIGWRVVGRLPDLPRAVVIAAPHTSNYDGLVGIAALLGLRLDIRFMAKHTLFRGPAGVLLRAAGGMPVDRDRPGGVVAETRRLLVGGDPFWLGITPEGTRTGAAQWKTGFYRLARDLDLPIVVATFCYRTREVRVLDAFWPGEDRDADLEAIYALLDDVEPRHPERLSGPLKRRREG